MLEERYWRIKTASLEHVNSACKLRACERLKHTFAASWGKDVDAYEFGASLEKVGREPEECENLTKDVVALRQYFRK